AEDAKFMRTAASLAVMAASVMIVGLAWLKVMAAGPVPTRPRHTIASSSSWSSPDRAWEHVATTLRPDPLTLPLGGGDEAQQFAYDSDIADWMLEGLEPRRPRSER